MVLVIAEAGVNHNGKLSIAKQLVDAAKASGADIVKFQSFKAKDLVTISAKKAQYQINNTKKNDSQLKMLKDLELSFHEQVELKEYCDEKNIEFLSTGFELDSLHFLNSLNLKRFKIPSGEITNLPYLRLVGSFNKPTILSTGMSNIKEIGEALQQLYISGLNPSQITVLHCTTEYPAPLEDINLKAINTISKKFNVDVGYSDHSLGIEVSLSAVALGAKIIEKHMTLSRDLEGPDHKASLEPNEFAELVKYIRNISIALGSSKKTISKSEMKNVYVVRKSIFAKTNIKKGELFNASNLTTKRPGNGISPMKWDKLIGSVSDRDYFIDDLILNNDLREQ